MNGMTANAESAAEPAPQRKQGAESVIYLNHAAQGYPVCQPAVDSFLEAIRTPPTGARHGKASRIEVAREKIAALLKVASSQITFTPSVTLAINQVIGGVLEPGDHCVIDNRSHNSVLRTVANQAEVKYSIARLHDARDETLLESLRDEMGPRTRLLCLNHVSNVTGTIYDVDAIIETARRHCPELVVLVDASQAAGLLDLQTLARADFVVFGGHKYLHCMPGAAVLLRRRELKAKLFGGTGTHSAMIKVADMPEAPLEVGTPNEPVICALAASILEATTSLERRRELTTSLTGALMDALASHDFFRILGRPSTAQRIGVVAIVPALGDSELDWAPFLLSQGIVARGGLHCCPTVHEELGLLRGGTLRFSLSMYNTPSDISNLMEALSDYASALRNVF